MTTTEAATRSKQPCHSPGNMGHSAVSAGGFPGYYLFADMNSYFATCEQQQRPELRGRPVGVVPALVDSTCCIAASYEAKYYGVKTGTSVLDARRLCPVVELVEARPRLYRNTHDQIVAAIGTVAPVHEVLSVDEMVVEPWRNERTLADALRLGQSVQDAIRRDVGEWMSCSVGLAPNAFLAKVASDFQKPRGLSVISMDDIPHKLYAMNLRDWPGIAGGMEKRFAAAGVTTTKQMYDLDMEKMRSIFGGIVGERWWRMIRGQNVAMPSIRRWQIGHSNVLAPEYRTPTGAWAVACRLTEKASMRLRSEGFHARRLSVSVGTFRGESWSDNVRFRATTSTLQFIQVLRVLWRGIPGHIARFPSHVSVNLQDIVVDRDVVCGLWDDGRSERLDAAVDRLNGRYGAGTVSIASSLAAVKDLDHARIPFGKPR